MSDVIKNQEKEEMRDNIDRTIVAIGDWIQDRVKSNFEINNFEIVLEMTKALAELVSARAQMLWNQLGYSSFEAIS